LWDRDGDVIGLAYSGSGERVRLRILLPHGAKASGALLNGTPMKFEMDTTSGSDYVVLDGAAARGNVTIRL
jgi:hypothetical protein